MKGHKLCKWLLVGRITACGRSCMFEHCKHHRAQLRKGSKEPNPCRGCGVGTQSDSQLCRPCGSDRVQHKLQYKERQARIYFGKVIEELISREVSNILPI